LGTLQDQRNTIKLVVMAIAAYYLGVVYLSSRKSRPVSFFTVILAHLTFWGAEEIKK